MLGDYLERWCFLYCEDDDGKLHIRKRAGSERVTTNAYSAECLPIPKREFLDLMYVFRGDLRTGC